MNFMVREFCNEVHYVQL